MPAEPKYLDSFVRGAALIQLFQTGYKFGPALGGAVDRTKVLPRTDHLEPVD
jgi:hypothetical protein